MECAFNRIKVDLTAMGCKSLWICSNTGMNCIIKCHVPGILKNDNLPVDKVLGPGRCVIKYRQVKISGTVEKPFAVKESRRFRTFYQIHLCKLRFS